MEVWISGQKSISAPCHKEIKCRLKAGNSCYYSLQTLFFLLDFFWRNWKLKYRKQKYLQFHIVFKHCLLHYARNASEWYLETWCWVEYLVPREMRIGSGEGFTMKNTEFSTIHFTYMLRVNTGKSGRLKLAGHVARMEEDKSAFKILIDKPRRKKTLGRSSVDERTIFE
jgi:hypothetical protein